MTEEQPDQIKDRPEPKPDEHAGFIFSSMVKIFDPKTSEVLVQKRGDD